MQIHIISIGKLSKEFQQIAASYEKMIKWKVKSTEITYPQKIPLTNIKQFEAKLIADVINKNSSYKVILDITGNCFSSLQFSNLLNGLVGEKNIDFVIGGAYGLHQNILEMADLKLSLSSMTLPHKLAKLFLLEQIYRAQTIIENHPYHK